MAFYEDKHRFSVVTIFSLAVLISVYCLFPLESFSHGDSGISKNEPKVDVVNERNSYRRVLDMNSCVSCHRETYSIEMILKLSKGEEHPDWKCRGKISEVVERNRNLRSAINRVDMICKSVFGNYYKSFEEGVAEYGTSSESEIMKSVFEKISELKAKHEKYLQQQVEDVKTGDKECAALKDEAVDIYGIANEVFMQRRLKNILLTVTLACFAFIFSVIIGYRKMLPSAGRKDIGEKGEQDGD